MSFSNICGAKDATSATQLSQAQELIINKSTREHRCYVMAIHKHLVTSIRRFDKYKRRGIEIIDIMPNLVLLMTEHNASTSIQTIRHINSTHENNHTANLEADAFLSSFNSIFPFLFFLVATKNSLLK